MSFNIAIDRQAGAGKSTIAKQLAKKTSFLFTWIQGQCIAPWPTIF
ncbi:MAG: hypothetical protein V8R80_07525 [Eubacterium sp.]